MVQIKKEKLAKTRGRHRFPVTWREGEPRIHERLWLALNNIKSEKNLGYEVAWVGAAMTTVEDLLMCRRGEQLGDEIINCYGGLVQARANELGTKVLVLHTFFFAKLAELPYDYNKVRYWLEPYRVPSMFEYEMVLVPVHVEGDHWGRVRVDLIEEEVSCYDGLNYNGSQYISLVKRFLREEHTIYIKEFPYSDVMAMNTTWFDDADDNDDRHRGEAGVRQLNDTDCGVGLCVRLSDDVEPSIMTLTGGDLLEHIRYKIFISILAHSSTGPLEPPPLIGEDLGLDLLVDLGGGTDANAHARKGRLTRRKDRKKAHWVCAKRAKTRPRNPPSSPSERVSAINLLS
jgi:hypothetical protein